MDKALLERTGWTPVFRPLPDLSVVKIGCQRVIDRGSKVILPLLGEVVAARTEHPMLLMTGGGTRSRHAYAIGLDLGMPVGGAGQPRGQYQRAECLMISTLLAPHGGVKVGRDDIVKLAGYLAMDLIPVMHAMPPYGLWEEPAEKGRIPPHCADTGAFLTAEVVGAGRCILVKDERGLYAADP